MAGHMAAQRPLTRWQGALGQTHLPHLPALSPATQGNDSFAFHLRLCPLATAHWICLSRLLWNTASETILRSLSLTFPFQLGSNKTNSVQPPRYKPQGVL